MYIHNYFDYALTGRCRWGGLDCWYNLVDDGDDFLLYELRVLPDGLRDLLDARSAWWEENQGNSWLNPGWWRSWVSKGPYDPLKVCMLPKPDLVSFYGCEPVGVFYRRFSCE
jgi:hypothetical protein